MRTFCRLYRLRVCLPLLLLTTLFHAGILMVPAAMPGPVSQAWAVRFNGPTNTPLQAASMAVGSSGDVFIAGQGQYSGYRNHILISRRNSGGTLIWDRRYEPGGDPAGDERVSAMVTRGTNVYVAGTITGTNNDGTQDFLALKYSETGELEWAARLDGPGHSGDQSRAVAVDGQGNVVVLGDSTGTNGSIDIVVLKYSPAGNLLWTYSYDSPGQGPDRSVGLRLDTVGNIHVAGTSGDWGEQSSVVTFKLDPQGHELWTARETSGMVYGVTASNMDLDSAGNVVTVGVERAYGVTWKYDANGNRLWMARYRAEEPASIQAVDVRFDGNGNIITAANSYGAGINDTVLIKYAADGQQRWVTRIASANGTAHLNALDVDGDGSTYLTTSPASDVVTVKVSPDGAQLWTVTFNSQGFFYDYGEFLKVAASGDIYVAGRSVYSSESFVSLVKYTQQPVAGLATGVVQPALQIVNPGTNVMFTVETTGADPTHFEWRLNARTISGATNNTLTLTNVQSVDRGDYSVIVSSIAGGTVSPEARLSVRTVPQATIAPTQAVAYVGTDAAFLASVNGNDFATLQWRHNGTNVPGATNEILRLNNLTAVAGGSYDIVVSTFGGTTTSSAAGLRISSALELIGSTPHRSSFPTWEYAPQLRVLPTGEFLLAARSNHLTGSGSSIVLHKHAAQGELQWTAVYENGAFTNAEPARILVDDAGNIFVSGLSREPYIAAAWAVLKYNSNGQLLWSRILSGTNLLGSIHAFAVDPQGNSTICILGQGTTVTRYNSAGDVDWSFVDPSPNDDTIALAVDGSGNSYVGTTTYVAGDNEIRLRKFDATGTLLWTRAYADGIYNRLGALAVDAAGHLIVSGTGELTDVPDSQLFVQKYSSAGEKLWETRTGNGWSEISYVAAMAVGPGDEITVLTRSDDDYELGEQSGVTRVGSDGKLKYRISEPQILVSNPSQLAVDDSGNAYVTGYGGRTPTGADAVTAKYDSYGNRPWLVYHDGLVLNWQDGLAVGVDARGDIRVLAVENFRSDSSVDYMLLHYRQRDPASLFRLQLLPNAAGTFHLGVPAGEPFRIEASMDLQNWTVLSDMETQQLLQPGATPFSAAPQRFFRLILVE